ncbi:double-strand-break repair protein rad21 homolog A-like isoform X2 [Stegodyphus dumicola]|uniref:double-strand-break repair protein rad21 homolog A-like isoform X2 n=1 Tax=Stegodyphus dumicola TaxID=202533 RepID=UPI0015ADD755|nr:double-strand-break repair protein rad21 homolog A-like isoform X2 [Stegodyphus dumicola]
MFYAQFMLAQKGPLAKIWLAAHWDKKLTKATIYETNIESCVKGVLEPKVKMALRTTGHLLLGIVRIYSRKAKYLLVDCNEAYLKLKMAFRPGVIDLPDARTADAATVTLPEVFYDFDTDVADLELDMDAQMVLNQSRVEDITLKEDYSNLNLFHEFDFDLEFDEREVARGEKNTEENIENISFFLCDDQSKEKLEESAQGTSSASIVSKVNVSLDTPVNDDGFGGVVGEGFLVGLFEDAPLELFKKDLLNNARKNTESLGLLTENSPEQHHENTDDIRPCSRSAISPLPSPLAKVPRLSTDTNFSDFDEVFSSDTVSNGLEHEVPTLSAAPAASQLTISGELRSSLRDLGERNLKDNESESFVLEPLDEVIMQGAERIRKVKRRRKLIIDQVKSLSTEEMKFQINNITHNVATIDLAPPTKRLMLWKETGLVEKLLYRPGHPLLSKKLSEIYKRNLTIRVYENEDVRTGHTETQDGSLKERRNAGELHGTSKPSFRNSNALSLSSVKVPSKLQPDDPVFSPMSSPERLDESQKQLSPDALTSEIIHQVAHLSITEPVSKELLCDSTFHSSENHHSSVKQLPGHSNIFVQQNQEQSQTPDNFSRKKTDFCAYSDGQELALGIVAHQKNSLPRVEVGQNVLSSGVLVVQPCSDHSNTTCANERNNKSAELNCVPSEDINLENDPKAKSSTSRDSLNREETQFRERDTTMLQQEIYESSVFDFHGWNDTSSSTESVSSEDQAVDETYEEFEERKVVKRTVSMLNLLRTRLRSCQNINFADLVQNNKRKEVAQKFFTLLILKKQQAVELEQESHCQNTIFITRGPKFYIGNSEN